MRWFPLLLVWLLPALTAGHRHSRYTRLNRSRRLLAGDDAAIEGLQVASDACPTSTAHHVEPPSLNVFGLLSKEEIQSIHAWLLEQKPLNLTTLSVATTVGDNYVFVIEGLPAPKADALRYLDKKQQPPKKFAKVVIHGGALLPEPAVVELKVGPLPICDATRMEYIGNRTIPYNARVSDMVEDAVLYPLIAEKFGIPAANATRTLVGGTYLGEEADTIVPAHTAPRGMDGKTRRTWFHFLRPSQGVFINPVGLYILIDHSGNDVGRWKLLKIVYNDMVFRSVEDFLDAFHTGQLRPHDIPADMTWASRSPPPGKAREFGLVSGPSIESRGSARYRVSTSQKYVTWMDWSFYMTHTRDKGLTLWDIRFRGERIIYELGLQEALSIYSGDDPIQAHASYLDSSFGLGSHAFSLVPGYDCPATATMLNISMHAEYTFSRQNVICLFEAPAALPVTRNYRQYGAGAYEHASVTKGFLFTARTAVTVDNYDYIFDYIFSLDGTIEARVAASGYLQGTYWRDGAASSSYGSRIHSSSMGSLHDHIMNYKIDFDIGGTKNSLEKTVFERETVQYPWNDDGQVTVQNKVKRTWVKNETGFTTANSHFERYHIANRDQKNEWGNPRAYRIQTNGPIFSTVAGQSPNLYRNAQWAKYYMAVTKRKETESTSSCSYDQNLPLTPLIEFDSFLADQESIEQEDLIVWVSMGNHHLPRAEDVPNTVTTVSHSSIVLSPFNYFDADPSADGRNAIHVTPDISVGSDGQQVLNALIEVFDESRDGSKACRLPAFHASYNGFDMVS
ncbi:hypothetical protein HDU85_001254 [Gaertneriomyces sp. JEL0708]|nr:hypothetical protein HDU85_001254 [Gaertneriomyces sp. JEL0708]